MEELLEDEEEVAADPSGVGIANTNGRPMRRKTDSGCIAGMWSNESSVATDSSVATCSGLAQHFMNLLETEHYGAIYFTCASELSRCMVLRL